MTENKAIIKGKVFFPNLDGLRFIAFFAVFIHHTLIVSCFSTSPGSVIYKFINAQKQNGALGVNLFFVLSGFLITYLLISEKKLYSKIHVPQFYLRRVLRIWPLYFLMVVIGFMVFPAMKKIFGDTVNETHTADYYLFFVSNFQMIKIGFADSSILNVLWSVGVEEQFYLIWPVVLFIIPLKRLPHFFILLITGTLFFRYMNMEESQIVYYHTFAIFSDMVVGGIAAFYSFHSKKFIEFIKQMPRPVIIIIYAVMFFLIAFRSNLFSSNLLIIFERLVLSLFFVFIILEQNFASFSFYKISKNKFLSRWGNFTYGLYCLHTIALLVTHSILSQKILKLDNQWLIMGIDFTLGLGLSMAMAYVSYTYFETPFLKLKNKFAYILK
jgi:peptidoglycan/LPS O-acetylase OafA/YrhL